MKNIYKILILFACGIAPFSACKEDKFITYKGGADLFFTYQRPSSSYGYAFTYTVDGREFTWKTVQNSRPMDSIICSFALIPENKRDSLILLPVSVMGSVSDVDRDIAYTVTEGSTDASNFEVVRAYVPAGSQHGGIFIRLFRDALPTTNDWYRINLRLKENENFTLRYDSIPYSTNTPVQTSVKDFRIRVINSLTKPMYWLDGYFGKWSTEKAIILMDVIGYPMNQLWPETGTPDIGLMPAFGGLLKKYLQQQLNAGTPVTYVNEKGEVVEMDWGASV